MKSKNMCHVMQEMSKSHVTQEIAVFTYSIYKIMK